MAKGREKLDRLCRYLLRCPVSLSRIHWTPGAKTLFYEASHDNPLYSHPQGETLDIFEFIARVLTQILPREQPRSSPMRTILQPRKHGAHYFGAYSSKARAHREKRKLTLQSFAPKDTQPAQHEPHSHRKSAPL